jgi:hypothetical protein
VGHSPSGKPAATGRGAGVGKGEQLCGVTIEWSEVLPASQSSLEMAVAPGETSPVPWGRHSARSHSDS